LESVRRVMMGRIMTRRDRLDLAIISVISNTT
jgi:hypothetical protein